MLNNYRFSTCYLDYIGNVLLIPYRTGYELYSPREVNHSRRESMNKFCSLPLAPLFQREAAVASFRRFGKVSPITYKACAHVTKKRSRASQI